MEPPSREYVSTLLAAHKTRAGGSEDEAAAGGALTRAEFLAAAQDFCKDLSGSLLRDSVCVFVLAPLIGSVAKRALHICCSSLHPKAGALIQAVPDAVFIPVATSVVSALLPALLARRTAVMAARRGARAEASLEQHHHRTARHPRWRAALQAAALLLALALPVALALAWPQLQAAWPEGAAAAAVAVARARAVLDAAAERRARRRAWLRAAIGRWRN